VYWVRKNAGMAYGRRVIGVPEGRGKELTRGRKLVCVRSGWMIKHGDGLRDKCIWSWQYTRGLSNIIRIWIHISTQAYLATTRCPQVDPHSLVVCKDPSKKPPLSLVALRWGLAEEDEAISSRRRMRIASRKWLYTFRSDFRGKRDAEVIAYDVGPSRHIEHGLGRREQSGEHG
jgi:hypothetical protein